MVSGLEDFIYIFLLLMLFSFIYALLGMQIYGGRLNFEIGKIRQNFDTFTDAFLTVFQVKKKYK